MYDIGNYEATLDEALKLADYAGFPARKAESRARAASCAASASPATSRPAASHLRRWWARWVPASACGRAPRSASPTPARCRCSPAPTATARATRRPSRRWSPRSWASPYEDIDVIHGDTDKTPVGMGTYGSRSLAVGGEAIVNACKKLVDKGKKIAAHLMEAAEADIEFKDGQFTRRRHRQVGRHRPGRLHRLRAAQLPAGRRARASRSRRSSIRRTSPTRPAPMSASWRSTPRPAWSRSCASSRSTISATSSTR